MAVRGEVLADAVPLGLKIPAIRLRPPAAFAAEANRRCPRRGVLAEECMDGRCVGGSDHIAYRCPPAHLARLFNLGHAGIKYDRSATNQHAALAIAKIEVQTIVYGAAVTKNTVTQTTLEAFGMAVHIGNEIARLKAESISQIAGCSIADFAYLGPGKTPDELNSMLEKERTGIQKAFDPFIQILEIRKQAIVDFINNEANPFAAKVTSMIDQSKGVFTAIDQLNTFDIGHAYIGLRTYYAANTIDKYCDDVVINEDQAMKDFLKSLPTVEVEGQPADPKSEVGAGWRETEAVFVGLSTSGYVPPLLENGGNFPFINSPALEGDGSVPDNYEIAISYQETGVYGGIFGGTSKNIQSWYDWFIENNPDSGPSDFPSYMTDLYDKNFPDAGDPQESPRLIDSINQYIAGNPTQRTVYSYFRYWWTP